MKKLKPTKAWAVVAGEHLLRRGSGNTAPALYSDREKADTQSVFAGGEVVRVLVTPLPPKKRKPGRKA